MSETSSAAQLPASLPATGAARRLLLESLMADHDLLLCDAIRVLGSRDRAEDVVQDAALRCLTSRSLDQMPNSPRGLLRRMVRNIALDHWRRAARDLPLAVECNDIAAPTPDSERQVAGREVLALVAGQISRLPPRERTAFVECRLKERKQKDIAAEMGVSSAYVHALITKSHRALKGEIKDLYDGIMVEGG